MNADEFMDGVLRTASSDYLAIHGRVTPSLMDLLHAVMGISSELTELAEAKDSVNAIEEVGDLFWYLGLGFNSRNERFELAPEVIVLATCSGVQPPPALSEVVWAMRNSVGQLASKIKAHLFYGRELDDLEVMVDLRTVSVGASVACLILDVPVEVVLETNQKKLRARYPEKFTEELANIRDLDNERAILEDAQG